MSPRHGSWLPTADDPLFVLAMDHRASFAKDIFGLSGPPTDADLVRMREAKSLIYEGLRQVAGSIPIGREGVLVDEDFGAEVARCARDDGVVLAVPIEKSGSSVFELEFGDRFSDHVERFDPDFFKVLVRYNPGDEEAMRRVQITRLAVVSDWAERAGWRWLFELLVPPTPDQLAEYRDQIGFDRDARPELTAEAISQFQQGGVHPTIWKLEGYETAAAADTVVSAVDHPAVCIVLGRDAPLDRLTHWLQVAAHHPRFVGFAVGRSIWEEPLRQLVAGDVSSDYVRDAVGDTYRQLVDAYTDAHNRSSTT